MTNAELYARLDADQRARLDRLEALYKDARRRTEEAHRAYELCAMDQSSAHGAFVIAYVEMTGHAMKQHLDERDAAMAAMREDDAMRVDGAIAKQRTGTGQGCEAADYEQRFTPADERDARLEKPRLRDAEDYST